MRHGDGGKGSDRRLEDGDAYRRGHDAIDWSVKATPKPALPDSWPFCANDGTCSCAKFHAKPDNCERRAERFPELALKPAALMRCAADRDGECVHAQCPQLRDGEPAKSRRHCPLDNWSDDES